MRILVSLFLIMTAITSQASAEATSREPSARPNILMAVADDWSYGHAGAYGCTWVQTPSFDRIAREGLLFTRAFTPNAKCAPSRAAILTGRNSWQLKEAANHMCYFPAEFKVYPEVLAEHGYHVGATAKGWAPGVAVDAEGNPRPLAGGPGTSTTRAAHRTYLQQRLRRQFRSFRRGGAG